MEEKNLNKITFGTYVVIVTIVALVLLVGILAGMLIQKNKEDKRLQEDNKITTSQAENKVENTTSLKDNNKDITSNTKTTTETDKYKEITKELEEEESFLFEKYEENNGKITLRGVIAEPYIVSSSELKSIASDGKLVLYGESYNVKKDDEGNYALYDKKFNVPQFSFIKKGNKYYLEGGGEYPTVWKKTTDYRKITLDKDTKCVYSTDSNDEKNSTVSNVFSKNLYWGGYFKFTFKNGKCVSVNEYVIGH